MPIAITARSQDSRLLDDAIRAIVAKAKDFGVNVEGPFPLPTRNSRDTKADSDRRTCVFSRVFKLVDPTPQLMESLKTTALSKNISFTMKQENRND